ncbi:hypothetical protein BGW42_006143 [Actinomortierella wolfii]|nr:hypothetical protein BGW42_006143 [Actinomortierella wolfii]
MRIAKLIFVFAAASAGFAYEAIISRGLWTGVDTTESGASLVDIFAKRRNHVTATSSLLLHFGAKSGYIPSHLTPDKGIDSYYKFRHNFMKHESFSKSHLDHLRVRVSGDLDQLQNAIIKSYPYADGQLVALNLRASIPTTSYILHGEQMVLFSLVEVLKPRTSPSVVVRLIEMPLLLETSNGRVRVQNQSANLIVQSFEMSDSWLSKNAELLAEQVGKATPVKKLVELFTTPDEGYEEEEDIVSQWIFGHKKH